MPIQCIFFFILQKTFHIIFLHYSSLKRPCLTRNSRDPLHASKIESSFMTNDMDDSTDDRNFLTKKRRMSIKENELIYLEEMVTLQVNRLSVTKSQKKKLLRKYLPKTKSKKLTFSIILASSIVLIVCASLLEWIPGSLSSIAFSLLNAIHGPVLFVYLCARFNEYSMKRYKYAEHRSTTSKLRNFKFNHWDVVLSCTLAICFVECLFFGKLFTNANAGEFYASDKMPVQELPLLEHGRPAEFCKYDESDAFSNSTLLTHANNTVNMSSTTRTIERIRTGISAWNYMFAISFNWYPLISFLACVLQVLVFNMVRFLVNLILSLLSKKK